MMTANTLLRRMATATFLLGALAIAAAAAAADQVPTLVITPDLVLGGPESDEEYILADISGVVEDSHGNIYVLDGRTPALYRFSPGGALLGTLNAVGEGPGDLVNHGVIAIDGQDRIHVAGVGGRVQVLTPELSHAAVYERTHPAVFARSLAIVPGGGLAFVGIDAVRHQTIHLQDAGGAHLRSFCDSYGAGRDVPARVENVYGGGQVAATSGGLLAYVQLAPYLVRVLDLEGKVLRQTDAGGAAFVVDPGLPEVNGDRTTFRFRGMSTGIAALTDGRILVSAVQRDDAGTPSSLLCLYDAELNLLARHERDGLVMVKGQGAGGRAYVTQVDDDGTRVLRARVAAGPPER